MVTISPLPCLLLISIKTLSSRPPFALKVLIGRLCQWAVPLLCLLSVYIRLRLLLNLFHSVSAKYRLILDNVFHLYCGVRSTTNKRNRYTANHDILYNGWDINVTNNSKNTINRVTNEITNGVVTNEELLKGIGDAEREDL